VRRRRCGKAAELPPAAEAPAVLSCCPRICALQLPCPTRWAPAARAGALLMPPRRGQPRRRVFVPRLRPGQPLQRVGGL
jgi:hypothetical protein